MLADIIDYTEEAKQGRNQAFNRKMKIALCVLTLSCIVLSTQSASVSNFCQDKADGNYAHPSKCDMYITCSNGIAHEMPCPAGLNWNDVTKECDWPRDAPCSTHKAIICEHQTASLQCSSGTKISIWYANYGRTAGAAVCPHPSIKTTNCVSSSAAIHAECQGKTSCTLHASNSVYGDPCVGTFKYIEVKYKCA